MKFRQWKKANVERIKPLIDSTASCGCDDEFNSILQSAFNAGKSLREIENGRLLEQRNNHEHVVWEFSNFPLEDGPCESGCEQCIAVARAIDAAGMIEDYQNAWWLERDELEQGGTDESIRLVQ